MVPRASAPTDGNPEPLQASRLQDPKASTGAAARLLGLWRASSERPWRNQVDANAADREDNPWNPWEIRTRQRLDLLVVTAQGSSRLPSHMIGRSPPGVQPRRSCGACSSTAEATGCPRTDPTDQVQAQPMTSTDSECVCIRSMERPTIRARRPEVWKATAHTPASAAISSGAGAAPRLRSAARLAAPRACLRDAMPMPQGKTSSKWTWRAGGALLEDKPRHTLAHECGP